MYYLCLWLFSLFLPRSSNDNIIALRRVSSNKDKWVIRNQAPYNGCAVHRLYVGWRKLKLQSSLIRKNAGNSSRRISVKWIVFKLSIAAWFNRPTRFKPIQGESLTHIYCLFLCNFLKYLSSKLYKTVYAGKLYNNFPSSARFVRKLRKRVNLCPARQSGGRAVQHVRFTTAQDRFTHKTFSLIIFFMFILIYQSCCFSRSNPAQPGRLQPLCTKIGVRNQVFFF